MLKPSVNPPIEGGCHHLDRSQARFRAKQRPKRSWNETKMKILPDKASEVTESDGPVANPGGSSKIVGALQGLRDLRDSGSVSDDEFHRAKTLLLAEAVRQPRIPLGYVCAGFLAVFLVCATFLFVAYSNGVLVLDGDPDVNPADATVTSVGLGAVA